MSIFKKGNGTCEEKGAAASCQWPKGGQLPFYQFFSGHDPDHLATVVVRGAACILTPLLNTIFPF